MKIAIQFGAGNIGRGFIGKLLSQSGYNVYFVDVNEKIIDELKAKKQYTVEVVGESKEDILVTNVDGMMSTSPEVLDLISKAEIITTAVGPNVLKIIAKTIAKGIEKRIQDGNKENLNIIACENMINGSTFLKEEVEKHISSDALTEMTSLVGFPNSAVDRIVPPMEGSDDVLRVRVEQFKEWIVEEPLFKGEIPKIEGMQLTDNLMAFVERKLFTLNTGHAITAYLGVLKGYETVKESIEDEEIATIVKEAMKESGEVLIKRYSFEREKHYLYIDKILNRFKNPYLKDEVSRVGREPLRKLSFNDRLIKPLRGTIEYNTKNDNLIKGIAAALKYRNPADEQATKLEERLNSDDLKTAIEDITSLSNKSVIEKIIEAYKA
ncbi:mannitol-1-phosphate 5-dehydrogenase [uncultured Ilyobacter sp.]|uniref:mannitol-1-phosphate 5-dehydrogenase n=1 Tax=uncultured Ilyobacter sp. TaxID=544433 RepID=UPI0029F47B94|nr:mannitol-1-phosphate 5-dehydrogenase [uncultured Ilyobacter sp.]